jgi:hypothetical protein
MNDDGHSAEDLAILEALNLDYNRADQGSDAERFRTLLAEGAAGVQGADPRRRRADPRPHLIHDGRRRHRTGGPVHGHLPEA